jgi:formate hydrogenlyase subunit 4
MIFQSLLAGGHLPPPGGAVGTPLAVGVLALTSGLAAACFVKAFGISFLAMPRTDAAAEARDPHWTARAVMGALAAAAVAFGAAAPHVFGALEGFTSATVGPGAAPPAEAAARLWLTAPGGLAQVSPLLIAVLLPAVIGVALVLIRARRLDVRYADTWGCGRIRLRRAVAADLRRALPAVTGSERQRPSRLALRRPVDHLHLHGRALGGDRPLRSAHPRHAPGRDAGAAAAGRIDSSVSSVCRRRADARAAGGVVGAMTAYLVILAQTLLAVALAPIVTGGIRWLKARLQGRRGAAPWQPYLELRKLLGKETVVSHTASWVFHAAPFVVFGTSVLAASLVPLVVAPPHTAVPGDLFALVYLLLLGTFFLALAGLDTGSPFGGMGSSREMTVVALTEPTIAIAVAALALHAGSTGFSRIVGETIAEPTNALGPGHLLGFAALFVAMLAETGRLPVDNPSTHLELTMIHEAMVLEYSGPYLALVEWGAALKLLVFFALGANLFMPWGIALSLTPRDLATGLAAFAAKMIVLAAAVAVLETRVAKLRLFRVPELLSASFLLALLAFVATVLTR